MRYKTKREGNILPAVILMIVAPCTVVSVLTAGSNVKNTTSVVGALVGTILALAFMGYCCTSNVKRNKYVKYGERFAGRIVAAEVLTNGRGEDTYFLYIEFYDGGKKTRFTEGYVGDPCIKLRDLKCDIYKLNNKYMEANFSVRGKKEPRSNLHIPTKRYKLFSRHRGYV